MATKILYGVLGLFLVGVFNTIYSVLIMFFTVFLFGIENETFKKIQSVIILLLAAVTSFALIYRIWPRSATEVADKSEGTIEA